MHHGREPEGQPAYNGDSKRHEHHPQVDGDLADSRETGWIGVDQRLKAGTRQQYAECAARSGEDHALGHGLAKEPAAAGAERRQDREFTMTRLGAREQQIHHIGPGDEQHESDSGL